MRASYWWTVAEVALFCGGVVLAWVSAWALGLL